MCENINCSNIQFYRYNIAVDDALTSNILSCNMKIPFWVSWTSGRLSLGYGTLPTFRTILLYEDPMPEAINYLGFATDGKEGEWEFYNIPGEDELVHG